LNAAVRWEGRGWYLAPVLFGAWAAAIALAPGFAGKALVAAPAVVLPVAFWTLQKPARWLALFFATALLAPPLPIAMGDSGPHPCLLFAGLGLVAGVLWMGEWRMAPSGLGSAFIALFGLLTASVAMAAFHSGAEAAAGSLARVALFGISVYVFFYAAYGPGGAADGPGRDGHDPGRTADGPGRDGHAPGRSGAGGIRYLYWAAVASALFACVDFYFQFPAPAGYGAQFVWLETGVYRRAQGVFYEASTLGNFCAFFLAMIGVALTRGRAEAPVSRKALVAGGAVFFAALVLSYSRASLVNVLVASAVLAWHNRRRVRWGRVAAVVGAGAWLLWRIFPAFAEVYWLRLSNSAEYFFTATEGVLSGRVSSWRTLGAWLAANPWQAFFGIGYKTLPYTNSLGGPVVGAPVVADNMYLSLLVETGIAGLAAAIWLSVEILRASARAARSAEPQASFCGTWMLCFWSGQMVQMFSGDLLTYWRVLPVYFWVLALAVRV